jgi:hypothetical protein
MNAIRRGAPVAVVAGCAADDNEDAALADRVNERKGGTTSDTPAPRKNARRFAFGMTTSNGLP